MDRQTRDIQNKLTEHIHGDEKLMWVGLPKQGLLLRGSDALLIPFSFMWAGFAIYWELNVISNGSPLSFKIVGIPFIIMALNMTFGRFFLDSKRRSNTIYGITNNRIIIKSGLFKTSITSLNIKTLSNVTLNETSDKNGTIILGNNDGVPEILRGISWPGISDRIAPALEMIPDAKKVYKQITELQG